jgi:CRISPR system Cascade subunit CasD
MVAFAAEGELAEELRQALRAPHWPLFLGRKSCPPIRPILEDCPQCAYASIEDAVKDHPRHPKSAQGLLEAYIEDETGGLERQDAIRINALRMYDFRNCRRLEVDPPCFSPA